MTATLNKISLIGNIGANPKIITNKDGGILITASLATNESVKRNGEWESMVEWHRLVFFGSLTKIAEHLHKGSQVFVEGKLRSNNWTDTAGITHRATSVIVTNVQLLGQAKPKQEQEEVPTAAEANLAEMRDMLEINSVEAPF